MDLEETVKKVNKIKDKHFHDDYVEVIIEVSED